MKLEDAKNNYYSFSQKTSDIVRQLGFAGLALIWIFRTEINGKLIIPSDLILAAILIINGLSFDLLHAMWGTLAWGIYHRYKEKKVVSKEDEILAPRWINWPSLTFFWLKAIVMIAAYLYLIRFLALKLL